MSELFSIKILASDRAFYIGEAVSVIFPAMDGDMQILAHHEDIVVAVKEGILRLRVNDVAEEQRVIVGIGYVRVAKGEVVVVVDSAERPEEIDHVRAVQAMERAKEQLLQDKSIQEYHLSQASLARAMVRLSEVNRHNGSHYR